jgi:predicted ATP-binding protein involved in virulence
VNLEGFLPFGAKLDRVSSKAVQFLDGDGYQVNIEDLSDGYRSILSMTLELIRQLAAEYGPMQIFSPDGTQIVVPGVVLVDEIDVHLHPTWQRRVGLWFREHFPQIQFIVTTHSPLVC